MSSSLEEVGYTEADKILKRHQPGGPLVTASLLPTQRAAGNSGKAEQDLAQLAKRLNPGPGPPEVPGTVRSVSAVSLWSHRLDSSDLITSQHLSAGEVKSKVFPEPRGRRSTAEHLPKAHLRQPQG